jgi:hypothetical protein
MACNICLEGLRKHMKFIEIRWKDDQDGAVSLRWNNFVRINAF